MPPLEDLLRTLRVIRDTVKACREGDLPTGAALRVIERKANELLAQLPSPSVPPPVDLPG